MAVEASQAGLSDNAASGLAYITIIPAIIFLIVEPFNRNPVVRFHSWQSIFFAIACIVVDVGLIILRFIPFFGWTMLFISPLIWLALRWASGVVRKKSANYAHPIHASSPIPTRKRLPPGGNAGSEPWNGQDTGTKERNR